MNIFKNTSGQLSVTMLFFAALTVVLITGLVFLASSFLQVSTRSFNRTQAFAIAEAGLEYYRWHLAHAPTDYWDGQGATSTGPYIHPYYNKEGNQIGQYELTITPPPSGSTVVTVRSTGRAASDTSIVKTIEVKFAKPSFARYAVAAGGVMRFGTGTEVFGEIMANGGIRFDGVAHNLIQSAVASYDDPDHGGQEEFGVHTHASSVDPFPPEAVPSRPDVFMAGRSFPVPALDFTGITQNLATIKTAASSSGSYFGSSTVYGYDLVFATSGRYAVYKVTELEDTPKGCTNMSNQDGWGTWSIHSETLYASGTIPENGNMFFEDNVWVRGQISNKRVTVASGRFPEDPGTYSNITVNQDLLYGNYNGSDTIALISQNNINVGLFSSDILRIDAALVAQNGRVGRFYYQPPNLHGGKDKCGETAERQRITFYGTIGTKLQYEFGFEDSSGYQERIIIYDSNLLYAPPPNYSQTADQYVPISWNEIQ